MTKLAVIVFVLLWVLTFIPSWKLLIKLFALSAAQKPKKTQIVLLFILYRLIIVLPYIALLILGKDLPDLLRSVIVGFILFGVLLSLFRLLFKNHIKSFLWNCYSFVYDGLLYFYPYTNLLNKVAESANIKDNLRILDAGCGTGNFTHLVATQNKTNKFVCIDSSDGMLRQTGKKLKELNNVKVSKVEVSEFLQQDHPEKFDRIILVNVLYAVQNRQDFWANCLHLLNKDGIIVITNSDKGGSWPIIKEHVKNDSLIKLLRPKLAAVFLIDYFISQLASSGEFDFISKEVLEKEIMSSGGRIAHIERCYGGEKEGVNLLLTVTHQ